MQSLRISYFTQSSNQCNPYGSSISPFVDIDACFSPFTVFTVTSFSNFGGLGSVSALGICTIGLSLIIPSSTGNLLCSSSDTTLIAPNSGDSVVSPYSANTHVFIGWRVGRGLAPALDRDRGHEGVSLAWVLLLVTHAMCNRVECHQMVLVA